MKLLILTIAALPSLAFAQTVDGSGGQRLDLVGEAPSACVLAPPSAGAGVNASLNVHSGRSAEVILNQLVDEETARPRAASRSINFPVVCNAAHTVVVRTTRGALVAEGAEPGQGFRNRLPYQVSADWLGQTATGASDSLTPVNISAANGGAGSLSLIVEIPGGGDPLVSGTYSDSLVVEFRSAI
jgi:hypothetical protein